MDEHRTAPPPERGFDWRRYVTTPRAAAGLGLLAAVLLLWPFSGFSWIPLLAGFGALLVVRILRFDGLLRGWDLPLALLVAVVGLLWSTGPWEWALAAGIGVLIAGLLRLPEWKIAAVGAALCLVAGSGFGITVVQELRSAEQTFREAQAQTYAVEGELVPYRVVGALLEGIVQNDPAGVCRLLGERARQQFSAKAGAANCAEATRTFHAAVAASPPAYEGLQVTLETRGATSIVNGCATAWASAPLGDRSLGRIVLEETSAEHYYGALFLPC
ncbi:MAG: hypothetical protein L0H84_10225 [Pseudonocardia sp.]|nr:hypothetical protein [Pseudonocardia sp.]